MTTTDRTLTPRVRAFLESPRYATIATTSTAGAPHVAAVWYGLEPNDRILVNSRMGRLWPTDLLRDPRISISVIDADDGRRWVGMRGVVETVVRDLDRARQDIVDLAHRYDGPDADIEEFLTQERVSFLIRVDRVHDHLDG